MSRAMNFNPGPSTIFQSVLEKASSELVDYRGTGMSILEHSHRGKAYAEVHRGAIQLIQKLLGVPDTHRVLLLTGGASMQFAMLPLNFLTPSRSADYVVTGHWSKKALAEARFVGQARVAFDGEPEGFCRVPQADELELDPKASYVHLTSNNTVCGSQFDAFPDTGDVPLVADMSSDILWRPIDVSRFALVYAGAQKNMGPSGVTVVVVREQWLEQARDDLPRMLRYRTHADHDSLYNTPPSFAVYLLRLVLEELDARGGPAAMHRLNEKKASLLYDAIDARPDVYRCPVKVGSRSRMNVVFNLMTPELESRFVEEATAAGFQGVRGHKSVGGLRVSTYNAAELAWVQKLREFMLAFTP